MEPIMERLIIIENVTSGCTTGSPARVGGGAACRAGPADRREEGGRQGGP
jgi:hypothetical protein